MKIALVAIAVIVASCSFAAAEKYSGTITDDMCSKGDHSQMRMGSNDAECTNACVSAHGAAYALFDGKTLYTLSGALAEKFAGQKVNVIGVLDAKTRTIQVDSITPAR
jgi:hypothetical protein